MLDNTLVDNAPIKGFRVSVDLNDDEKRAIKGFAEALDEFTERRANIPTHQIAILCRLLNDEGKSQRYYADKWQLPRSTISRAMLDLGRKTRSGDPGLGLIEERANMEDLREQEIYVSSVGKALLRKVAKKVTK